MDRKTRRFKKIQTAYSKASLDTVISDLKLFMSMIPANEDRHLMKDLRRHLNRLYILRKERIYHE